MIKMEIYSKVSTLEEESRERQERHRAVDADRVQRTTLDSPPLIDSDVHQTVPSTLR